MADRHRNARSRTLTTLLVDAHRGATTPALLGALVEAGASLELVEAAVGTLGSGPVRLSLLGGGAGSSLRLLAPAGAPVATTWATLRPHMALLAAEPAVVAAALATLDALMAARAAVHGVAPGEVELDELGGPDELAGAVALAAAAHGLGAQDVLVGPVGHGTAQHPSLEGTFTLPGPVVAALLTGRPAAPDPRAGHVVDPLAAAWLRVTARPLTGEDADVTSRWGAVGRGRLGHGRTVRVTCLPSGDVPVHATGRPALRVAPG